ncbi:MAG: PKD domain-containing protein [Geothermobacteraceae bacterium]
MAHLFNGPSGTSDYDLNNGQFREVQSNDWSIYRYASVSDFERRVDLSMAGNIIDCGECHVGGGAMEYVPYGTQSFYDRIPLRELHLDSANWFYNIDQGQLTAADVTAFNYFIDTLDVDGDGNRTEAQYIRYDRTGVLDMDCFICHLDGYDFAGRRAVLRQAKLDATRAVGAGIAGANSLNWDSAAGPPDGYGTTVIYNDRVTVNNGFLYLGSDFFFDVKPTPSTQNCANCHFGHGAVDWKKRGDNWISDWTYEVHSNLGCMGCHQRNDGFEPRLPALPNPIMGTGRLGHDPAKGDAPYSSVFNRNDGTALKNCATCHLLDGDGGQSYGAPNPTAAHQQAGLTARIVRDAGGALVSHVDLIDCSACHARKLSSDPANTGGALVDATGADAEGRLTEHAGELVDRDTMTDRTLLSWYQGRMLRSSLLTTILYRDVNGIGVDANLDGRAGALDPLLQTQVLAVNQANGWQPLTDAALLNGDRVTSAMIADRLAALDADVAARTGQGGAHVRYAAVAIPFKVNHGISPADRAWGAGGCADCHAPDAGFYNGSLAVLGDGLSWEDAGFSAPFAMVNGQSQPSDLHPMVRDKKAEHSIAVRFSNAGMRPLDRSELLWEESFMAQADFGDQWLGGRVADNVVPDPLTVAGGVDGWLFKIEAKNLVTGEVTTRTRMLGPEQVWDGSGGDAGRTAALLSALGPVFAGADTDADGVCDTGLFEFCIVDAGGGALGLLARSGYQVRLHPQSSVGERFFNMMAAAWQPAPVDPWLPGVFASVDQDNDGLIDGRVEMVAYLDSITPADVGIGIDPVAVIATPAAGDRVVVETPVTFSADTSVNTKGSFSYSWDFNDGTPDATGATVQHTFATVGSYQVALRVTDEEGKADVAVLNLTVVPPPPPPAVELVGTATAGSPATVQLSQLGASFTRLIVYWGDGQRGIFNYDPPGSETVQVQHTWATPGDKLVKVLVYDGSRRTAILSGTVTIE